MIASEDVVGVCDPEACWSLVSIEETVRCTRVDDEIVLNQVISLNSIFNKDGMAHRFVDHVA